jgi:YesN/AraC family two-component response regulator
MPAPGSILIVDDDPGLLQALSTALSPPHDVRTARTGVEALSIVQQRVPDMVLLDYVLPDVSGLAVLHALKQAYPILLTVLMTGFGSEDVAIKAFRGGVRDYLKKPIRLTDLRVLVEKLLEARRRSENLSPQDQWSIDSVPTRVENGPYDVSVRRAMAFIDRRLDTELRLDLVAREAGMSKFHFCRHFKEATGLTFREFLTRRRIARAVELLRDPTRLVSEVYLDVGFKNLSHFSRVFLKLTGQSPSRYRQIVGDPAREDVPPKAPPLPRS